MTLIFKDILADCCFSVALLLLPVVILTQSPVVFMVQTLSNRFYTPFSNASTRIQVTQQSIVIASRGDLPTVSLLTPAEVSHLRDVYHWIRLVWPVLLVLLSIGLGMLWVLSPYRFTRVRMVLIGFIGVGVIGSIFFKSFFLIFHQVFFPQGNWSFPENSLLIDAFPAPFWLLTWLSWLGGVLVEVKLIEWWEQRQS